MQKVLSVLGRLKKWVPGPGNPPPPLIPRYKPPKSKPIVTPRLEGLDVDLPPPSKTEVERLPAERLSAVEEYPQLVYKWRNVKHIRERGRRKAAFVWGKLTGEPGALVVLGGTVTAVYGLAIWEAFLNVRTGVSMMEIWQFVFRFANANTFCAITNTSVAPETIVASLHLSPSLFHFVPLNTSPETLFLDPAQAESRLLATYLRAGRGMIAGYMGVASLLRLFNWTFVAGNVFRERVLAGREAPFLGVQGRTFRLCGRKSDTLTMSLTKDKEHVLPIIEDPAVMRQLLTKHTENGTVPIAWTVRESDYGSPSAWEGLVIDEPALLKTKNGERLLYIEADGTNSEDALRLGTASADLSLEDASAAFRMIEDTALVRGNLPDFQCVRVFLGDVLQKNTTGGGNEYTLRQRVRFRHEVDILVDSKLPILTKIIEWSDKVAAPGWQKRKVVFETDSQEYYHNLSTLLKTYGFTVLDISEVTAKEADQLPRLIYYRRTAGTVNALRATLDTTDNPPPLCAVIDTKEGLDTLYHLRHAPLPPTTSVICSSEIYDATLRQIRTWCRMGYSTQEIQRELDARSAYISRIASAIADMADELKREGALKKDEQAVEEDKHEVDKQKSENKDDADVAAVKDATHRQDANDNHKSDADK
ncbi:hypothetical protein DFJ77DRAFT_450924 [Powellomyces hirtus]|nr:hypothetical protein DFJ77DRAFT_450924 [Powellomyces hirtus]